MAPLGTIKTYIPNPRLAKAQIAGEYSGAEFKAEAFDLAKDKTPEFMAKFPMGKIPVFESAEVNLFESNAIAYYAALQKENNPILGATAAEKAEIFQWVLFSENELNVNIGGWVYPIMGYMPYMKPNVDAATEKTKRAMDALNKILLTKTYLVGESVTFADIVVVCTLAFPFQTIFDKAFRDQYKNVTRYFNTVVAKENFKKHLTVQLCETPLKYTPPKKEKKETPKKEAAPKKEKKEAAPKDEEEAEAKPAPKPKSKLDLLPPSKFIMDAWKREYSNNDTDVAMKWFWENFDAEGYSIWKVDYKYNDELTLTFMSNNLIGGFYARLERAHKYAFGSMLVRGKNSDNTISGIFVVRGQEVPFEIYDAADYESYNFVKIEPSDYEAKKDEIYKFMAWDFEDCVDGKVFK